MFSQLRLVTEYCGHSRTYNARLSDTPCGDTSGQREEVRMRTGLSPCTVVASGTSRQRSLSLRPDLVTYIRAECRDRFRSKLVNAKKWT